MNARANRRELVAMLIPLLHVSGPFGPVFFGFVLPLLVCLILFKKLVRYGGIGPVRWNPQGGAPQGPRPQGPRPFWAQPTPEEDALATLTQRLASGDISPEEYLERSSVLRPPTQEG